MKNNKNRWKLLLDIAMVLVLALLYKKMAISLAFHEIVGLALMAAFVLHLVLNRKWIATVTKQLFRKSTPLKTRIGYLVDALLLVGFVLIGISGALISKVVFSFQVQGSWKAVHYFCSALCLLLMGVHLGLHSGVIGGVLKKLLHWKDGAARAAAVVLTVLIFGFGCWSFTVSSFTQWVAMPFRTAQMSGMPQGQMPEGGAADASEGAQAPAGETPSEGAQAPADGTPPEGAQAPADGTLPEGAQAPADETPPEGVQAPAGDGLQPEAASPAGTESTAGHGGEGRGENQGGREMRNGNGGAQGSVAGALLTLCQFFSMMYVAATLTVLLEKGVHALRRKQTVPVVEEIL